MSWGTLAGQPISYYFRRAFDSIFATPVIAGVTITSIAVSVLLAGSVLLVGSNAYRLVASWGAEGVDLSMYLRAGVDDGRVVELKEQLAADPAVVNVYFISNDEAWMFLAQNLGDSAELLDGLDASILPASLEVTLARTLDADEIEAKLAEWHAWPEVDDLQYNREWTLRFRSALGIVRWVAWALGALALVASIIIVGATFQLAVFSRQEEMEIMRLVGASGMPYWGPVMLAGLIQGIVGSAAAVGLLFLIYRGTAGPLVGQLPMLKGTLAYLAGSQYMTLIIWGAVLGAAGSWLGMRRFGAWK